MKLTTIELKGRVFWSRELVQTHFHISDYTVRALRKRGFPAPMKIGQVQFFDREKVEAFFLMLAEQGVNG
jgi:hypothetical protein